MSGKRTAPAPIKRYGAGHDPKGRRDSMCGGSPTCTFSENLPSVTKRRPSIESSRADAPRARNARDVEDPYFRWAGCVADEGDVLDIQRPNSAPPKCPSSVHFGRDVDGGCDDDGHPGQCPRVALHASLTL